MTRRLLSAVLILSLAGSCSKTQVYEPAPVTQAATNFKDDHINVVSVKLDQPATGGVRVSFATRYEVDVKKIEVLGGKSRNNLCAFFEAKPSGDSHALKVYEAIDEAAEKQVNYYMIRYITNTGDWSYSPLYQISVK